MDETTIIPKVEPIPRCPQCHAVERKCTRAGPVYRMKTKETPHTKVQAYVCTECGYKGRGNMFHMTEVMRKDEKKTVDEVVVKAESVDHNDSN